jgi:hypothetical protein
MEYSTGSPVDVAPFAENRRIDNRSIELVWSDARDIEQVVLHWSGEAPDPGSVRVEYWHSRWPEERLSRTKSRGAGSSGWAHEGDWFNGDWQIADTQLAVADTVWSYTFAPVNAQEFTSEDCSDFDATYRRTYKIRVTCIDTLPDVALIEAKTDSRWRTASAVVEWNDSSSLEHFDTARVQVFNGHCLEASVAGNCLSLELCVTDLAHVDSHDATIVTLRTTDNPFSFRVTDLEEGPLYLKDSGILVSRREDGSNLDQYRTSIVSRKPNLYDRIFEEPEQTFERAWSEMPAKTPFYLVLGMEGRRQRFAANPDGSVYRELHKSEQTTGEAAARDTARIGDDFGVLRWDFGLPDVPHNERTRLRGYIPAMTTAWETGGVRYSQTAFATLLDCELDDRPIRCDDSVVGLVRLTVENRSDKPRSAVIAISTCFDDQSEQLSLDNGVLRNASGNTRAVVSDPDLQMLNGRAVWNAELAPNQRYEIVVKLPYFGIDADEIASIREIDFDDALAAVCTYWERRIDAGTQIDTPVSLLNDYYRSHLTHLLINHERHPATQENDRPCDIARVGSFSYAAYANESIMQIAELQRRGYYSESASGLETFVRWQGTVPLPGDFSNHVGVYYGAGGYECGNYNQHHGWVLWGLAEQWRLTRDRDWFGHVETGIVEACDWIAEQCNRSQGAPSDDAFASGLLPAGVLEDVADWWHWLSTNVYTWWGMSHVVTALEEFGNENSSRLRSAADQYKRNMLAAFDEATVRSPVVRLSDGTAIPHTPSHPHLRDRSFGWIRETLEGAIHLICADTIPAESDTARRILQDYEDNLYLSDHYGYTVRDLETQWFSRGGFSMQPNLLFGPLPYLMRNEIEHYVRATFNAIASGLHADTRMLTEHPLPELGQWRGDQYKTSDEAIASRWLTHMFVWEYGDDLLLGWAMPHSWLRDGCNPSITDAQTSCGPVSVRFNSNVATNQIEVVIEPPPLWPRGAVRVKLRHPDAARIASVTLNGDSWDGYDVDAETVDIPSSENTIRLTVSYI